eukprot:1096466-Prymnesium_polylepis.1
MFRPSATVARCAQLCFVVLRSVGRPRVRKAAHRRGRPVCGHVLTDCCAGSEYRMRAMHSRPVTASIEVTAYPKRCGYEHHSVRTDRTHGTSAHIPHGTSAHRPDAKSQITKAALSLLGAAKRPFGGFDK